MSAQALNIMLADLFHSEDALARYQQDPDTVARQYNLTQEEQEHLQAKDMGWLYTHGAHPYILVQYAFAIRYELPQYLAQLKAATANQSNV